MKRVILNIAFSSSMMNFSLLISGNSKIITDMHDSILFVFSIVAEFIRQDKL